MNQEERAIFNKALSKWGVPAQMQMGIEECSELIKELCKEFRGKTSTDKIADEVADVGIMLDQMMIVFNIEDKVAIRRQTKVDRLKELVKDE